MGEGTARLGKENGTAVGTASAGAAAVRTGTSGLPAEPAPPVAVPVIRRAAEQDGAAARVRALSTESRETRRQLDALIAELDRRGRDAMDWRRQARRHARGLLITAGGIAAFAITMGVSIARRRRRRTFAERAAERAGEFTDRVSRLGRALRRAVNDPDRVATGERARRQRPALPPGTGAVVVAVAQLVLPYIAEAMRSRRR
jgi:hypothetical protein